MIMKRRIVNTIDILKPGDIVPGRRVGNSTRQIDAAIQALFAGHIVIVMDAWEEGNNPGANRDLSGRILDRVRHEHHRQDIKSNFFEGYCELSIDRGHVDHETTRPTC